MFSFEINFIHKVRPEAKVISRRRQIIKRTPFDIQRRRDDDKMNYTELQLQLSCVYHIKFTIKLGHDGVEAW